jgi:hypothetical protein
MPEQFEKGHAVIVGVGADLPNTINDAVGLADILKDPSRGAYPPENIHLLTREKATRQSILVTLDNVSKTTNKQDTVVVYFSGHGHQVTSSMGQAHS